MFDYEHSTANIMCVLNIPTTIRNFDHQGKEGETKHYKMKGRLKGFDFLHPVVLEIKFTNPKAV